MTKRTITNTDRMKPERCAVQLIAKVSSCVRSHSWWQADVCTVRVCCVQWQLAASCEQLARTMVQQLLRLKLLLCSAHRVYTLPCNSLDARIQQYLSLTLHLETLYIVIIKANEMHNFSKLFDKVLYIFRTGPLSIIRSISALYTQQYMLVLLAVC